MLSLTSDLELDTIVNQLVKRKGWTPDKANIEKQNYLEFLQAILDDPKTPINPPTQAVDEFWHQHILNTKKYANDCQNIFGFFVHHLPSPVKNDCCDDCDADLIN